MPLKTCGEPVFMASVIRFILHSLGRVYMQSHIWSQLCLYHLPSDAPPPVDSYNWSDESRIPLLLNSSKQDIASSQHGRGEGGGREGGRELEERQMWRRQNLFCVKCQIVKQVNRFSRETCLTVNSAHTATRNTALCKSSVNAFTFHSCSYFKQA